MPGYHRACIENLMLLVLAVAKLDRKVRND